MDVTRKPIVIVGCGPGSRDFVIPAAEKEIRRAEVLVGTSHLLALFPRADAERIGLTEGLEQALCAIAARPDRRVAVLVTGDPGVASLSRNVTQRFGCACCRVIPGISSVQLAFARLGLSWERVRVVNAHAGPKDPPPQAHHGPLAILTGSAPRSWQWVVEYVSHLAPDAEVAVCEDLSLESERVRWIGGDRLGQLTVSSRAIVVIPEKEPIQ